MNNELRQSIQKRLGDTYNQKGRRGIIRASLRIGKTLLGLSSIKPNDLVLVCYPKLTIRDSWKREMERIGFTKELVFSSFASLKKLVAQGFKFDQIIIDECHKLSSKNRREIQLLSKHDILGLTGTLKFSKEKAFQLMNLPVIAQYDLEEGIKDGLVKDYKIFIHFIKMSGEESRLFEHYTERWEFAQGNEEEIEEELKNPHLTKDQIKEINKRKIEFIEWMHYKYMSLRTNLIYNSETSINYTQQLIDQHKDKKVLIFSLRTETADQLAENTYHSKKKDVEALEEFRLSESGHLSTINMISEGITIKNLNTIICHTVTSNTEDFQQKLGRGLQLSDVDGEVCTIHVVCLLDTIQERWIELSTKSLNQWKIWYVVDGQNITKIDSLKYQYPDKQLYLYKGSFCYPHHINERGYMEYMFIGDERERTYSLNINKLKKL